MPAFRALIEFLVGIGLVVTAVSNYLIVNKLWKRRAVRDVADSISVGAALLGLITSIPFLILWAVIDHSTAGTLKTGISILTGTVFVAVGSGVFVPELRERRFLSLFARALKQERRESGDLLRALVQPKGADRILRVLQQLAAVDGRVDEEEAALIRRFARQWHLPEPHFDSAAPADLLAVREGVTDYLAVRPPTEQAAELIDLLQFLADADTRVTREEALVIGETAGMLRHYVAGIGDATLPVHEVVIVPQSDAQVDAVRSLLPAAEEKVVRSGRVFSAGHYFSAEYAEMVCEKYIALGLFTTLISDGVVTRRAAAPVVISTED